MIRSLTGLTEFDPKPDYYFQVPFSVLSLNKTVSIGGVEVDPHDLKKLNYSLRRGYRPVVDRINIYPELNDLALRRFLWYTVVGCLISLIVIVMQSIGMLEGSVLFMTGMVLLPMLFGCVFGAFSTHRYLSSFGSKYIPFSHIKISSQVAVDVRKRTLKISNVIGPCEDVKRVLHKTCVVDSIQDMYDRREGLSQAIESYHVLLSNYRRVR